MQAKLKTIVTLSVIGIIVPFLGIPLTWKMWLSALLSLVVVVTAYVAMTSVVNGSKEKHKEEKEDEKKKEAHMPPFIDSRSGESHEEQDGQESR